MSSIMAMATMSPRRFAQVTAPGSITAPTVAPTLAASGTGYTLAAGTYYVKYTWVNASGIETTASPESAGQAITLGQELTITLPAFPTNAVSANIYISTTSGAEKYQGNTTTTTYNQTAPISTTSASPPSSNLTGQQTVYTAPANTTNVPSPFATAIIKEIVIVNQNSSSITVSLYLGGVSYFYNLPIAPNDTKIFTNLDTMLSASQTIQVGCSLSSAVNFTISGVEVQ